MNKLLEQNELQQIKKYGLYSQLLTRVFSDCMNLVEDKTDNFQKIINLPMEFSKHPSTFSDGSQFIHIKHDLVLELNEHLCYTITPDDFNINWNIYCDKLQRIVDINNLKISSICFYTVMSPLVLLNCIDFTSSIYFGSLVGFKNLDDKFIHRW